MNKKVLLLLIATPLLLISCNNGKEVDYQTKEISVYRNKDVVDKTIALRFYNATPHVPYISVSDFYKEFFATQLTVKKLENNYSYYKNENSYLRFDVNNDSVTLFNADNLSNHPDFKENSDKTFLIPVKEESTNQKEKIISLKDYNIEIHSGGDDVYVPLSLLSSTNGGLMGYNISYNGKDIFVLDNNARLFNEEHGYQYYGDNYTSIMANLDIPRESDMAEYAYNQLCYNFDNYRGYTSQLMFGDNNLLSIGLDSLLTKYYPEIKTLLKSVNKKEYYFGLFTLFNGLYDGGHTSFLLMEPFFMNAANELLNQYPNLTAINRTGIINTANKISTLSGYQSSKSAAFNEVYIPSEKKLNYYLYDNGTKTAYIGFDNFEYDSSAWNKYYTQGMKKEDIPLQTDSFAFVRDSLYKALEDEAENVVLDLSTNGGGNSGALNGICGIFNGAVSKFECNYITERSRHTETMNIDMNLDGVFDERDVQEANKFKAFKLGVLTSSFSFSCGNLLPSILKEHGAKIIGQKSGGGSCAINFESTADGLTYVRSSHVCFSNESGENVDNGVPLDYEIPITKIELTPGSGLYSISAPDFYDFNIVSNYFKSF